MVVIVSEQTESNVNEVIKNIRHADFIFVLFVNNYGVLSIWNSDHFLAGCISFIKPSDG
jgi:hypothetical protein